MSNVLGAWNPIFYAQEALVALRKRLGLAGRVYRGYDDAQTSREKGDTITIKVPSAFVAMDAPSVAQDVSTTSISMKLDQWKEVKYQLSDKELAYTSQQIITDHIEPAAYALADKIDQSLAGLVDDVPWYADWSSPAVIADITSFRAKMFANKVQLDNPQMLHAMVAGDVEGELLGLQAFTQFQGSGDAGVAAQLRGYLGTRYGFNFFANQNTPQRTNAAIADAIGAINNGPGYAAGTTLININAITANATLNKGDIVVITGHTQQYVVTVANAADGAGAVAGLAIFGSAFVQGGGLESAVVNGQVVTIVPAGGSGTTKTNSLAFHNGAFALGWGKLPDFYDGNGIQVFSVLDPITKLAVRARMWVDGNNSKFYVALDCLFGVKTLDGNKAIRIRR